MARKKITENKPLSGGELKAPDEKRGMLLGNRFVFTAAQNNTELHEGFWFALQQFCKEQKAQLVVSRFTYNKAGWQKHGGVSSDEQENDSIWYDPRIEPFVIDEQVKVAPGLVFCGELDILPTASLPLATLHNYTGPNSGIVPHAKVHMESHATMKHHDAKFMYTTGACTLRNYIQRKAGQVATFHHVFGALLVEIDDEGNWFARQLMADDTGAFYDLNTRYDQWGFGQDRFESVPVIVTLGDVHIEKMDHTALACALDMLDYIKPKHVFLHDLIDFEARNHHNIKDTHFLAKKHFQGIESVKANIEAGARFIGGLASRYPSTKLHVVRSNHDQAFERWLKDHSAAADPANAGYWHMCNAAVFECIEKGQSFDVFVWAMQNIAHQNDINIGKVHWVQEDESVIIYDIEHGMHGHRGVNGAKGNPRAFRQLGRKANTGHTHSAGILDGVWTAGVLGSLDMDYNAGPSSWSHSHIITYPNGKRCMITQKGNKWRV